MLAPPLLLTLIEAVGSAIAPRFGPALHRVLLALGLGVFAHTVVKRGTELGAGVSVS